MSPRPFSTQTLAANAPIHSPFRLHFYITYHTQLHVEAREWKEAFTLAQLHPGKFSDEVFLPYAEWLAIEDRFEEALVSGQWPGVVVGWAARGWTRRHAATTRVPCSRLPVSLATPHPRPPLIHSWLYTNAPPCPPPPPPSPLMPVTSLPFFVFPLPLNHQDAYEKVGRLDLSTKILNNLTHNAVAESRFSDAAYCYWRLAMENVKMGFQNVEKGVTARNEAVDSFWALSTRADVYHAYSMVHKVGAGHAPCLIVVQVCLVPGRGGGVASAPAPGPIASPALVWLWLPGH